MVGYDEDKDVAVLKLDPKDMVRPLPSPLLLTQRHAHCSLLQAPGCIGPAIAGAMASRSGGMSVLLLICPCRMLPCLPPCRRAP